MSPAARAAGVARVLLVFGTRPEAIKLAPVWLGLRTDPRFAARVAVTGQHRALLDQVLALFGLVPDADLNLSAPGQTLTGITTGVLSGLAPLLAGDPPDLVLVQGDTTSTFAATVAAFYAGVPVAHLEAGLRSGDLAAPWPEEANRRLVTRLAGLHLAPTALARSNLLAEGVDPSTVVVTGNTVVDALRWVLARPTPADPLLDRLAGDPRRVVLVTAHRRESWGAPLEGIAGAVADLARGRPDVLVVVAAHLNPLVQRAFRSAAAGLDNVAVVDPPDYAVTVALMDRAVLVLTDSGGLQEEAPSLGTPVLVLRDVTERSEGLDAGVARLVGTDRGAITDAAGRLLDDPAALAAMARAVNPYGDGQASRRVVAALAALLGRGHRAEEFAPLAQATS